MFLVALLILPAIASAQELLLGLTKPLALHKASRAIAVHAPELWIGRTDGQAIIYRYDIGSVKTRSVADKYIAALKWDGHELYSLTSDGLMLNGQPLENYSSRISSLGCYPYQASDVLRVGGRLYLACGYGGVVAFDPDEQLAQGAVCEKKPMIAAQMASVSGDLLVLDTGCLNIWRYNINGGWSYFSGYRYMQPPTFCPETWVGLPATQVPLPVSGISAYGDAVYTVGGAYGLVTEIKDGMITRTWCLKGDFPDDYSAAVIAATRDLLFILVPRTGTLLSIGRAAKPVNLPTGRQTWCSLGKALTSIFCQY